MQIRRDEILRQAQDDSGIQMIIRWIVDKGERFFAPTNTDQISLSTKSPCQPNLPICHLDRSGDDREGSQHDKEGGKSE